MTFLDPMRWYEYVALVALGWFALMAFSHDGMSALMADFNEWRSSTVAELCADAQTQGDPDD